MSKTNRQRQPQSAREAIEYLGGCAAVARMTNRTLKAVWNWKKDDKFPAYSYLQISQLLAARGCPPPPPEWFGMTRPSKAA